MEINNSPPAPEEMTGESSTLVEYSRPFLTTPFEEYTVTEGLLLAILLCLFVSFIVKLLKEGFYWLL